MIDTHIYTSSKLFCTLLTAKASWNSKTSMSLMDKPARSRTLGVPYVGLNELEPKTETDETDEKHHPLNLLPEN